MVTAAWSYLETVNLGKKFSGILRAKDVVLLQGDLGTGKTTFVKGIIAARKRSLRVLSPSFTLIRSYKASNIWFHHVDLYRIESYDAFDIGLGDYLYAPKTIVLIEWADKLKIDLPYYLKVEFSYKNGENSRKIKFSLKGYNKNKYRSLNRAISLKSS